MQRWRRDAIETSAIVGGACENAFGSDHSSRDGGANMSRDAVDGYGERISGGTAAVLDFAGFEIPFTDYDAMRYADQIGVGEFDAWTLVAIVEHRLDAHGLTFRCDAIGSRSHCLGLRVVQC